MYCQDAKFWQKSKSPLDLLGLSVSLRNQERLYVQNRYKVMDEDSSGMKLGRTGKAGGQMKECLGSQTLPETVKTYTSTYECMKWKIHLCTPRPKVARETVTKGSV